MKIKNRYWVLRDAAAEGGEGGGGSAATGADGGDGGAGAEDLAGGAGGQGGSEGDKGGEGGSALDGAGGESAIWKAESVAEKLQVKREDGTIDVDKTLEKVETARAALEKRMGSGDIRPKEYTEYKVPELPEMFKDVQLDTERFAKKAHEMGLSQKQYEDVMGEYFDLLPQMVGDQQKANASEVISELSEVWGKESDVNFSAAKRAATTIASSIGMTYDQVNEALGNNPMAIRILAAVGKEMGEDKTPSAANGGIPAGFDVKVAMASEAYNNASHPEHDKVTKQVNAYYEKNVPKE